MKELFDKHNLQVALFSFLNGVCAIVVFMAIGFATHHFLFVPKAKVEAVKHILQEGAS